MKIEVNGKEVLAHKGETILQMLQRIGISVPTLCHMKNLFPTGACRMCVVEVEGYPGLIPSCAYPVEEGMNIQTHSPRAIRARKTIVELLLSNHPDDCLYCVRNGECELQKLAEELGVRKRRYSGSHNNYIIDTSSPSIIRDPSKCILCGKCVRVCEEIQGVSAIDFIGRGSNTIVGTAFHEGINVSSCINCGQCIMVCPTGALREKSDIKEVTDALQDPDKFVVVQHAPSVSVTLGEEFDIPAGRDVIGVMTGALRQLGFDRVFDTAFGADLTIMEEASELVHRITNGGVLPMMTSCSPGWIKFVEQFFPEFIPNLSSCKSPQQMLSAITKSYFAERENIDPKQIFNVTIMPCTAKKFEAGREELSFHGLADIDAVLTTRELSRLIRLYGLDIKKIQAEPSDTPFGERSSAGKLFGASGGVMEAAVRTAYYLITGKDMEQPQVSKLRGLQPRKEVTVTIDGLTLGLVAVSGLGEARKLMEELKAGRNDIHFIEVMSCPGGCIAGGGQPLSSNIETIQKRMKMLYAIDENNPNNVSYRNYFIRKLYEDFLGEPLGHTSHELLHTNYCQREVLL